MSWPFFSNEKLGDREKNISDRIEFDPADRGSLDQTVLSSDST